MTSDRLTLRLPAALRNGLEVLGRNTGRNESELAREAIEEFLLRHESLPTCYDVARQAGIIGCVDSGKSDLSTNPKHMQGFGE